MTVKRTERGWAGHFCMADRCQFRRNTLLEIGDIRIVVSTVGAVFESKGNNYMEIGYRRHFETMVFHARFDDPYWDSDVSREIGFESPWSVFGVEKTSDFEANKMHERVVEEITQKLLKKEVV